MTAELIEQPPAEAPVKGKPRKPETVTVLTGYCREHPLTELPDGRQYHALCPGSGPNGAGSTWFCRCDCHVEVPTCRDCRQPDVELTLAGTCVDLEGCAGAVARKQAENPVWQQIHSLKVDIDARAVAAAEARKVARQARAAALSPRGTKVPSTRPARAARPAAVPQRCHCGCGAMTKGGRFQAGHDAKLKGFLVKRARMDTVKRKDQAADAMAELIARDWPRKGVSAVIIEAAEKRIDQHGIDGWVDAAVRNRYEKGISA